VFRFVNVFIDRSKIAYRATRVWGVSKLLVSFAIVSRFVNAFIDRSKIAYRATRVWGVSKLLVSLVSTVVVRASTQRFGKVRMTWVEIGRDFLIVILCYALILFIAFVINWIVAPARLKQNLGQASLEQVLATTAADAVRKLDDLMDADEDNSQNSH
jgi:hypothetical protein